MMKLTNILMSTISKFKPFSASCCLHLIHIFILPILSTLHLSSPSRIKINMLPGKKYFLRSPGAASASNVNRQTPMVSPLSSAHQTPISYHHTPLLRSPISPYIPSPCARPTLYASPGKFTMNSPVRHA